MTLYTLCALVFMCFSMGYVDTFKIGILLTSKPPLPGYPSTGTSGAAITMALSEARRLYSPDIELRWEETECDEALAMMKAYDLGRIQNVSVIIGPACEKPMDFVTKLMSVLRPAPVPTITWLPRQHYMNDTAISTYWTFDAITDAFVIVLKQFKWRNIGILYSNRESCRSLLVSINAKFPNNDLEITRNLPIKLFTEDEIRSTLQEVKNHARVILLCIPSEYLFHLLTIADSLDMTAKEFVYIYCRFGPDVEAGLKGQQQLSKVDRDRVLSPLIQISFLSVDPSRYGKFVTDAVQQNVTRFPNCCQKPDEFAMSLYDTLLEVTRVLSHGRNGTHNPANGTDSLTSLRTLGLGSGHSLLTRNMLVYHYQAGVFEMVANINNSYNHIRDIVWPTGSLPPDPPNCGWDGRQCEEDAEVDNAAVVGSCVAAALVVVVVGGLYFLYRKSKFEKELVSMIWKVNNEDIKMRRPRGATQTSIPEGNHAPLQKTPPTKKKLARSDTKGTLGLGSTTSIDKTVLFAPVGSYKGSIVAVRNIKRRSISLTREVLRDLKTLREIQHENLNPFIGVSLEPGNSYILNKYCSKGSLQDVLENDDIKLDNMFQMSFLMDLTRGLDFLHKSPIKSHGNLKSSNCVIDSRWVLKITDFGAVTSQMDEEPHDMHAEHDYYSKLLWTAPELLRLHKRPSKGTQKADIFSFAIIMQEIVLRCPPYYFNNAPSNKSIINRLRSTEDPPYRPRIPDTADMTEKMLTLMVSCWHKSPDLRPDTHTILKVLIDMNGRRKINIMDNMIKMLEAYSNNLEELVAERTEELAYEKQKTDRLLYQMLPPSVAEQLKRGDHVVPETFSESSLFFSDIVGFTNISSDSSPLQVIDLLNDLYTTFDEIIGMHDVYKVETIGDAYMVASGIPRRNGKRHAGEIANMALDLLSAVTTFRIRHMPGAKLQLRIGLHTGPCAAGVVGLTMPRYCLFGDTINMASRMESTGKAFHIHVSTDLADALNGLNWGFQLLERGIIEVKGKGLQKTYWLVGKNGYDKNLPEEMQKLARVAEDAKVNGRPMSPTDTHISTGSAHENTSMYGNIFRRASFAVRFIRKLSHSSRDNSPHGSNLSVKDAVYVCDEPSTKNGCKTLNIPHTGNGLRVPSFNGDVRMDPSVNGSENNSPLTSKKKKKKKKSSKKDKKERRVIEGVSRDNDKTYYNGTNNDTGYDTTVNNDTEVNIKTNNNATINDTIYDTTVSNDTEVNKADNNTTINDTASDDNVFSTNSNDSMVAIDAANSNSVNKDNVFNDTEHNTTANNDTELITKSNNNIANNNMANGITAVDRDNFPEIPTIEISSQST